MKELISNKQVIWLKPGESPEDKPMHLKSGAMITLCGVDYTDSTATVVDRDLPIPADCPECLQKYRELYGNQ